MANPQRELGIWSNDNQANVVGDNNLMAICGTQPWLGVAASTLMMALNGADAFLASLSSASVVTIAKAIVSLSSIFKDYCYLNMFLMGSDGVVTFNSACKRPVGDYQNIYVSCSHIGYGKPASASVRTDLQDYIKGFLAGNTILWQKAPWGVMVVPVPVLGVVVVPYANRLRTIANYGNATFDDGIANALIFDYDAENDVVRRIYSTVSDARGQSVMREPGYEESDEVNANTTLYAWAPGYEMERISVNSLQESVKATLGTGVIALKPDANYTGPRNPKVQINNDALITTL